MEGMELLPELLPVQEGKPTLVLDLDYTLIAISESGKESYDFVYEGSPVRKRRGLDKFLHEMAEVFELVVFSASDEAHVSFCVRNVDPQGKIGHFIATDHCDKEFENLGRDMKRVIYLDDFDEWGPDDPVWPNLIMVPGVCFDIPDTVLEDLTPVLLALAKEDQSQDLRSKLAAWKGGKSMIVNGKLVDKSVSVLELPPQNAPHIGKPTLVVPLSHQPWIDRSLYEDLVKVYEVVLYQDVNMEASQISAACEALKGSAVYVKLEPSWMRWHDLEGYWMVIDDVKGRDARKVIALARYESYDNKEEDWNTEFSRRNYLRRNYKCAYEFVKGIHAVEDLRLAIDEFCLW